MIVKTGKDCCINGLCTSIWCQMVFDLGDASDVVVDAAGNRIDLMVVSQLGVDGGSQVSHHWFGGDGLLPNYNHNVSHMASTDLTCDDDYFCFRII